MTIFNFLFFLIIFVPNLRASAEITDERMIIPSSSEAAKSTLECWYFALKDTMCKLNMNITGDKNVEIIKIFSSSINAKNLSDSNLIFMSRDKVLIERMPKKLGSHFMKLEKLIVMKVGLKTISKNDFLEMQLLKTLNLGFNELKQIPYDAFVELKNLETIYLDGNKIQSLNIAVFQNSRSLEKISLSYNKLENLDEVFDNLFQLREIYLNDNHLKNIKINFKKLENLELVDLRRNSDICVKCERQKKSVKDEAYEKCDYEKTLRKNKYQECYHKCVLEKIQSQNGSNSNLVDCSRRFNETQKLNEELFKESLKCNNKANLPSLIQKFDRMIFIKLHNESVIRDQFDSCIEDEISSDLEVSDLMKNCTEKRTFEEKEVEDFYNDCIFCKPSRVKSEMEKCNLVFKNSTTESIEKFDTDVIRLFRN